MPAYLYKAIDDSGQTVAGEMQADSVEIAGNQLSERGLIPVSIKRQQSGVGSLSLATLLERITPVKPAELILFTKQFRTMVRAGVSMLRLLEIIEQQTENKRLKAVIRTMAADVKSGSSLVEAFGKHSSVFSPLYVSMVRAGESSGALPEILERLTYLISHEHKIKSDIRSAMFYPLIVLSFLAVAFFVLLTFVVPKFVNLFSKAEIDLPIPTQICLFLYEFLNQYFLFVAGGVVIAVVLLIFFLRTEQGQFVKDALLLRLPILGPLFVRSAMARFASIFSILQASGIAILEAMDILTFTINNAAISRQFGNIKMKLQEGHGLSGPLLSAKYFTPMIVNMVAIGEESGNLDEMLREAADHYDTEVEFAVERLSESVGPLLTVGLAAVVGFFALAIFLPMWDLTQTVR
jgi:type II secretory pathway component PulF